VNLSGLLIYNSPDGKTFESPFEVPGIWTVDGLCLCQNNQTCNDYVMKFHTNNYLLVIYEFESHKGKIYTVDIFRGVCEWYGLANILAIVALETNPEVGVGLQEVNLNPQVTACKFNAYYQYISTSA
jgi:hypothetical protein